MRRCFCTTSIARIGPLTPCACSACTCASAAHGQRTARAHVFMRVWGACTPLVSQPRHAHLLLRPFLQVCPAVPRSPDAQPASSTRLATLIDTLVQCSQYVFSHVTKASEAGNVAAAGTAGTAAAVAAAGAAAEEPAAPVLERMAGSHPHTGAQVQCLVCHFPS